MIRGVCFTVKFWTRENKDHFCMSARARSQCALGVTAGGAL